MQAEQRHSRRRRRMEGCPQLLLPVVVAAVAGVCLSASLMGGANAFVQPSIIAAAPGRREVLRHGSSATVGYSAVGKGLQRSPRMVLGESTPAACRRALQRAWRASSTESVAHEQGHLVEQQQPPRGEMDERGLDLRLTTFNLLAPCYKRMHALEAPVAAGIADAGTGLLAMRAKTERTARESEFTGLWRERALETVDFIRREMSSSDIICLQEFWFNPEYEAIFRSALGDSYDFHTVKRTGGKSDGVAVLLRRGKWDVESSLGLSLSPVGDRVALIMHLRSRQGLEVGGVGEDMILVNTHLAFPHSAFDRANQMSQIEVVTEAVEAVVRGAGLPTMTPRVVVGDLNVEGTDQVCRHLGTNGFRSAFASLHREQRVITHRNHRGEEVMVDHVFVKAPGFAGRKRGEAAPVSPEIPGLVARLHEDVSVEEAKLLPGGDDAATWNPGFFLSDHRPLTVSLKFPAD